MSKRTGEETEHERPAKMRVVNEEEDNDCPLCGIKMNPTDSWALHKFGKDNEHRYHTKCINDWLSTRGTMDTFICPLCNTPPPLKNEVKKISSSHKYKKNNSRIHLKENDYNFNVYF